MAYQDQPAPESIQVEVMEVLPQEGAVVIQGPNGLEGKYNIVAPANISYAQLGPATVKFSGEDISYLRNSTQGQAKPAYGGYQRSYQGNSGYKKPYSNYQRNNYQPAQPMPQANNYQANPMVQQALAVRNVLLSVEDIKLKSLANLYNKISSVGNIFATQEHVRPNVETEKIEGTKEEKIHLKYDALIYIKIPNSVSYNSLVKLAEEIDKPDEKEDY